MSDLKFPEFPDARRLSVFGIRGRNGNPAMVFYCRSAVSDQELKTTAAGCGGPTCAFISGGPVNSVRFFTPVAELPFCVHGALAAGASLADARNCGSVRILIRGKTHEVCREAGDTAAITLTGAVEVRPEPDLQPVLDALGLEAADLAPGYSGIVANAGSPKWLVHVNHFQKLLSMQPRLPALKQISRLRAVNGAYVFATVGTSGPDVAARGFNPAAGVDEDAATGVAAAALAWVRRDDRPNQWLVVDQYVGRNHTGRIRVRVTEDGGIQVGGEIQMAGPGQ